MAAAKADVRNLVTLVESGSTARVLNLARRNAALRAATPLDRRLFRTAALDRAVLVKHKLRLHERDQFLAPKSMATKLLIPIDPANLNFGAHSVFVDEKGYDQVLVQTLGVDKDPEDGVRDRAVLAALNELPSLDPFLSREHLTRRGFAIAEDYFDISPADLARMSAFVKADIMPLVSLCFGAAADAQQVDAFSQKLLHAELDASMEPLRLTLRMEPNQFVEGVFCWKGFLYYKWALKEVKAGLGNLCQTLSDVQAVGDAKPEETAYIASARGRIKTLVKQTCRDAQVRLLTYDQAFDRLTKHADPGAFRDFLLNAPKLFLEVGEKLGAVQHISSFWAFRFTGATMLMPVRELFDVLTDFESSLSGETPAGQSWAA